MKHVVTPLLCGAVLLSWAILPQSAPPPDSITVAARTIEATVWVETPSGYGSGVIIDSHHILTCNHVVGHDKTVDVYFFDFFHIKAKVLVADPETDLALLEFDVPFDVVTVDLAPTPAVPGQHVMAVGNGYGMAFTVTMGVISARDRTLDFGADGELHGLLQHDSSINPGNSGGPLVDMQGRLVGLNNAIRRNASGMGFAIDLVTIRTFLDANLQLEI